MSGLKEVLRQDAAYTEWGDRRVLAACAGLTEEELLREMGDSHGGLLRTLRHIYYAERHWVEMLRDEALPPLVEMGDQSLFGDAAPEPSLMELGERWPKVWAEMRAWVEGQDEETLLQELATRDSSGREYRLPMWELARHAANHSTLHRGQMIGMLRRLGRPGVSLDLMGYLLEREEGR